MHINHFKVSVMTILLGMVNLSKQQGTSNIPLFLQA